MRTEVIGLAVLTGVGATLVMDAWNVLLNRIFDVPSLNYCMLGRWLRYMPETFRHASIAAAARKEAECAVGWVAHYSIGVLLAMGFLFLGNEDWLARPRPLPAVLYGLVTVTLPFLLMQPALGLGIASAKAANPTLARTKSLATHAVYGLGLYLTAAALGAVVH